MAHARLPAQDRAGLSPRARDHLHELRTPFTRLSLLDLIFDLCVGVAMYVVVGILCLLASLNLVDLGGLMPRAVLGPATYDVALWILHAFLGGAGVTGLLQYWMRRVWGQTYGSQARLWTGLLGTQLLLGAAVPATCLVLLSNAGLLLTWQAALFVILTLIYLRHAMQVFHWAR